MFDEYIKEHLDPIAAQLYSLLKYHVFAVELDEVHNVSQERLELLITLLERMHAAETSYLVFGKLPDLVEQLSTEIAEVTPATPTSFAQTPAFLAYGVSAFSVGYYGP